MKRTAFVMAMAVVLLAVMGWKAGWFAREPTYQGNSVTDWLDRLSLYEPERTNSAGVFTTLRSPEAVASDPALLALLKIGSNAVPILVERIQDRAGWRPDVGVKARFTWWIQWRWSQWRGRPPIQSSSFPNFPQHQRARKNAAGLALLALGANANGGFTRYMEAYAAAPKHESIYGTKIAGPPVGCYSSAIVRSAISALPERREEVLDAVLQGLQQTNAWCLTVALESLVAFPGAVAKWKDRVAELTQDDSEMVQVAALAVFSILLEEPLYEDLHDLMPPSEIALVASAAARNPGVSERTREFAEHVRRRADGAASSPAQAIENRQPIQ